MFTVLLSVSLTVYSFDIYKAFLFVDRTYFKGLLIGYPYLFYSYFNQTSSILSILIKCIVSCSFVTPVKFVIMKINAARKVAHESISDLESSAHVPSFKRDLPFLGCTLHQ